MNGSLEACITARPFKGTARLDPRTKFLLLIFLGCVSYFVNGELTSLALVSGVAIFIAGGSRPRTAAMSSCGAASRTSATAPEACGVAIEVPEIDS